MTNSNDIAELIWKYPHNIRNLSSVIKKHFEWNNGIFSYRQYRKVKKLDRVIMKMQFLTWGYLLYLCSYIMDVIYQS